MLRATSAENPIQVGFFLDQRFSIVPFINLVDALRIANRVGNNRYFEWLILSLDGEPVAANSGMKVFPDLSIKDCGMLPNVFVISGNDPKMITQPGLLKWLRQLATNGSCLGALGSGSIHLAQAGLLDGYRATIHWEFLESFRESFRNVEITNQIFEIDRNRITCAGGAAVVDLALHLIQAHFGTPLAMAVSDSFVLDRVRHSTHPQPRIDRHLRIWHPVLAVAIELMENNLEEPLPMPDICEATGITGRQLQRLFKNYLGVSPRQYYIRARLNLAQRLLIQSDLRITEVAIACGYGSLAQFSRSYRDQFGSSPSSDRRNRRLEVGTVFHTHVRKIPTLKNLQHDACR